MQFKHPELLWALFLLVIPIIIHLFQLRRFEKVLFTNVAFLKNLKLQTRKSSTLKKWLTLFTRLLLLSFLILAFAQPFFPTKNSVHTSEKETVIYLDNSFSMQAKGSKGPLLQRAIQEMIANIDSDENFTLFTNNESFTKTTMAPIQNKLLASDYAPNQLSYNEAYLKGAAYFSNKAATQKDFIFISDFQRKDADLHFEKSNNIQTHFVQLSPENIQNISIDSVYISKKETNSIEITTKISSEKPVENVTVSLFNNDNIVAKTGATINTTLKAEAVFSIASHDTFQGKVAIQDDGLRYDNELFFSIQKPEKINVLSISDAEDSFLERIYTDDEFSYINQSITALDFNQLSQQNVIVINQVTDLSSGLINTLKTFTSNGGSVVIIPAEDTNTESFNQLLAGSGIQFKNRITSHKNITTIHFDHPLYQNVFDKSVSNFQYPSVQEYYGLATNNSALNLEDTAPFLATATHFYVFAAPLDRAHSNFQNSPLIVPTLYNIAQQSLQLPTLYYTIGSKNTIDVTTQISGDAVLEIAGTASKFIPMQTSFSNKVSIVTNEQPDTAGNYEIQYQEHTLNPISYNFSREESNLHYHRLSDANITAVTNLSELFDTLKTQSEDSALWKWFVIFALLFLCVEMFILKFLK